jgi:predicted MFS family arabinose efflux permease
MTLDPAVAARPAAPDAAGRRAMHAVYLAFAGSGFAFASWASRIPQVRDQLHMNPGTLGLVLLCISIGSIIAMPLAGLVVSRLGEARAVFVMSIILATGLAVAAVGERYGIPPVAVGLFLVGFGNGTWDVAMNVQGAAVEQRLGKSIMSRFHAGWSVGTVAGALIGAGMVALHVPVTVHLLVVAVAVGVAVPLSTRRFLPPVVHHDGASAAAGTTGPGGTAGEAARQRSPLAAWLEPRTLVIGLFVLCMAFSEGTGNDWLSVAMIDGYRTAPAIGTLAFAFFLAAMTTGRWFGPLALERFGRVPALRGSAVLALVGLLLVVFGGWVPLAFVGALLWGIGTALGFPTGMSAAADDPRHAAGRVSVAASIGYMAFLAGPPLIGFLGDHTGVRHGLTVAAALLAIALLAAGATRPLVAPSTKDGSRDSREVLGADQAP